MHVIVEYNLTTMLSPLLNETEPKIIQYTVLSLD